jgi:2-polyprenyl-3-methyl-5-hydroxy-6-metoxy-1,4-benzoquinol methylase
MNLRLLAPTYQDRYTRIMGLVNRSGKILDLGCADGFYSRAIAGRGNQVIGIEANPEYVCDSSPDANPCFLQARGEKLPFEDGYFDSVLCIDVIEHVEDDAVVLSEISRVLRPGGQLVLSVPNVEFPLTYDPINFILKPFHKHLPIGIWGFGHRRLYSAAALESMLSRSGLKVIGITYLTHSLAALCENYLPAVFRGVAEDEKTGRRGTRRAEDGHSIYRLAHNVVRAVLFMDRSLFADSHHSVGVAALVVKL